MTLMPTLETTRLQVRPFALDDLTIIHQILDVELGEADVGASGATTLRERERWLQWTILGYEQFAQLHQPPYGERAVSLKATGQVIGAVGYVPCLDAFEQLPHFSVSPAPGGWCRRSLDSIMPSPRPFKGRGMLPKRRGPW